MGSVMLYKRVICTVVFKENPGISCDLELRQYDDEIQTREWQRIKNSKNLQMGADKGEWKIETLTSPNEDGIYASCLFIAGEAGSFFPMAEHYFIRLDYVGPHFMNFVPPSEVKGPGFMKYVNKKLTYRIFSP